MHRRKTLLGKRNYKVEKNKTIDGGQYNIYVIEPTQ